MIIVRRKYQDEHVDKMLKRFKNKIKVLRLFETLRKNEYFEKPSIIKRRKKLKKWQSN